MSIPAVGQTRLVIVGASGMVGGYALRYALENSAVASVTSIGRRNLGISHPKLKEVLHPDFADCSALAQSLSGQHAAIFCLGVYTGAVSDAQLHAITVDYTVEFARVLRDSSPAASFSFLSGSGADQTGRSRMPFARYKGEAENALLAAGFPHVYLFRPSLHLPRGTAQGTELHLPLAARNLPGVPCVIPQPGDSRRRLGVGHGGCRHKRNRAAPESDFRES